MKAVVVDIRNQYVSVLSDDGCVVKIKNNGYEIGQVIQMKNQKNYITKKITMLAASAAAVFILGVGTWAYASPYSYVSMDVNPSIEFTVNRFDRVLKVKAVNDDGEELLQVISLDNLENKTIQDALTNTVKQITEAGYFDGIEEGGIVIATSAENQEKADKLAQELQETVEDEVAKTEDVVEVEAFSVGLERVQKAKDLGVTPGKLNLVEKLQASAVDPESIDIEEWLQKPVKDIMKATKENRKAYEFADNDTKNDGINTETDKLSDDGLDTIEKSTVDNALNDQEKTDSKALKDLEKAEEKAAKAAEKAAKAAEKAAERAKKAADKAAGIKEQEAKANAASAKEAAKEALTAAEKASQEAKKAANSKDKKQAEKAKDTAEKAAKEADKAAKKAEIEAEKARQKAEKASEQSDKKNNKNADKFDKKTKDDDQTISENSKQGKDNALKKSDAAASPSDKKSEDTVAASNGSTRAKVSHNNGQVNPNSKNAEKGAKNK